jgi:hypothetical protein
MPDTAEVAMPGENAYATAERTLGRAVKALLNAVHPIYYGVAAFKAERAPTFEEIGRVVAFTEAIRGQVEEVASWFGTLEQAPARLEYVRLLDNKPESGER